MHQQSYSTSNPVSTEMGDRSRYTIVVCNQPPRPTQPPTLSRLWNEYQPKCDDAVWLGSKGSHGSFHVD